MACTHRARLRAFAALLAVAPPVLGTAQAPAPPLAWIEPGPTARLFLQQPLDAPEPLGAGRVGLDVRLLYSNALVVAANGRTAVDVDEESALVTLALRAGLGDRAELIVALPVIGDGGGIFDRTIERIEATFQSSNYQRAGRPRGLAHYLLGPAGGGLERRGAATGLGDAWAGLKWLLAGGDGARPALALRGAVKAPTGGATFGSGTWDAAAGLLAAWSWPVAALRLSVDGVVPSGRLASAELSTRPHGAAQAGLAVRLGPALTGHLQLSAHLAPLARTGIPQLDDPLYDLLLGATVPLGGGADLELAAVENFASPRRGADAALLFGVRVR